MLTLLQLSSSTHTHTYLGVIQICPDYHKGIKGKLGYLQAKLPRIHANRKHCHTKHFVHFKNLMNMVTNGNTQLPPLSASD